MAFPTSSLTNNQVHKEGNRAFVYDSALGVWDQVRETDITDGKNLYGEIGGNVTLPAGHVVQTVIQTRQSPVVFSAATYATAGIPVTITPAYSNSKMIIQVFGHTEVNSVSLNAGHDSKVTRATGSSESESSTAIYLTQWFNYFNRDDFSADYYPAYNITWVDTGFPHQQITYGMFGRKYAGDASKAGWKFCDRNHSSSAYQAFMMIQEIKQ